MAPRLDINRQARRLGALGRGRDGTAGVNVGQAERWASAIGGGAVALYGLTRGSLPGVALAALVGGPLIYRGVTRQCSVYRALGVSTAERDAGAIKVEQTATVDKPAEELYRFWRNFENLPRFMKHLESVKVTGDRTSHWVARAPLGQTVEWDAEIDQERGNELIGWRSLPGADVVSVGSVRFSPAAGGRGTVITVELEYSPPGGGAGAAVAKLFGEEPSQQVDDDLRRFKALMEAGEIPTTDGQPAGERAPHGLSLGALKEKLS
jgi:uncharacterized membrane protein